jgi:pimeloyl-ACP methyl ester carboxylesterase
MILKPAALKSPVCLMPSYHLGEVFFMEKITSKDGTLIAFVRSGAGPSLLLVHGTTADHRRWASISPPLEQHFSVYAMDRRGRGESGDAPDHDLMREAEDVAAVVDAIGEPTAVLGHSYGAICSLEAALLTDRIRRLVLYEPPIPVGAHLVAPPGVADRMQELLDNGEKEAALEVFMRRVVEMPEHELNAYRQLPMWSARVQMAPTIPRELAFDRSYHFDPEKFANLQVPTLLLLGGDSPSSARQAIELVDSALPDSRIVVMPGQQHIAMDMDPELFLREVSRFLLE